MQKVSVFYLLMRPGRFITILTILLFVVARSRAQSPQYGRTIFGTRDGLLSSKIYTLSQAQNRILWIGTEFGASSYDGYHFTNYQYTDSGETLGRIRAVTADLQQGIWLGGDKGLFYLKAGHLRNISIQNRPAIAIESLHTNASGNIWLGEMNALYKISAEALSGFANEADVVLNVKPYAGFIKRSFSITSDNRQNIYVGSHDGVFKFPAGREQTELIWKNPDPYQYVMSVTAPSPDSIFWNCYGHHPSQMISGKITLRHSESYIGQTVFTSQGKIFTLTTTGVALVNDSVQHLVSFGTDANNAVTALVDAEENIWIGTWEGLFKFRKTSFRQYIPEQTQHPEIFSMLEKKNGDLLFGGNRGILFKKDQQKILPQLQIPPLFKNSEVFCLYEDNYGAIWAGSGYEAISRLQGNQVTHYPDTGFLKDNNCETFFPAPDGKLLACTENGVTVIDPAAAQPMTGHYSFQKEYARYPELFNCFHGDGDNYWFYGSQGLYLLRNGKLDEDMITGMPVKNLYINKIVTDRKKNIWVATFGKGVLKCREEKGKLVLQKQYDSRNGLPSDIALSVLVDKNDQVWWGDYMSVSVLLNAGDHEQLTTYNEKDGLPAAYYQTLKLEQQKDGTIWGLTSNGLFSFHPDSVGNNALPPVLLINEVKVQDSDYVHAQSPSLSFKHNSVQFVFAGVCLSDPSKVKYAYRLIGLDSNWTFTSNRIAQFNGLAPGEYRFEVKACNNSNLWTTEPVQYSFTIRPPFWKTNAFRIFLVLFISAVVFLVYRRRIRAVQASASLKQQLTELEARAIRAQMNPHFIFNSLNAIQEAIVTEKIDAAYDYLSRFSKLLRMVLDHSEKNLISLGSELETIRLYLSLESLRFSQSFNYKISVNPALDPDDIYIPTLLLQPFVENAIWHGLINLPGEKRLNLIFEETNGMLECIIEDNGVGRARAAEIKQQKLGAARFESKGTRLAFQRVELLNRERKDSANIEIIDLTNAQGEPSGTRVVIRLAADLMIHKQKRT